MRWDEARGGRAGFRIAECSVVLMDPSLNYDRRAGLSFVLSAFVLELAASGPVIPLPGWVAAGGRLRGRHRQSPRKPPVLFVLGLPILFFLGLAILLCFGHRALQSISIALRRINEPMRYFSHVRPEHEHLTHLKAGYNALGIRPKLAKKPPWICASQPFYFHHARPLSSPQRRASGASARPPCHPDSLRAPTARRHVR